MTLSVLDAAASDIEIGRVALDTEELAAHLNSGHTRGAGTHEWVGFRSSRLSKEQFSALIDTIHEYAARHGIALSDEIAA